MTIEATEKPPRFYELDILRFLAALAVVLFHYVFLNQIEYETLEPYPVLGNLFKFGYLGVELFFIISGFVILLTATKKDWAGFIISRITRLYPAFWVAVSLTTVAILLFGDEVMQVTLKQFLWNLTMLGNFVGVENIDPVYWTLQVEIKFYFWIFVILLFRKIQHIEFFIFLWLLASIFEVFHLIHGFTHPVLMPEWAPYFSAGALFYRITTHGFTRLRFAMLVLAYLLSVYFAIQGAELRTELYKVVFSPWVTALLISSYFLIFAAIVFGVTAKLHRPWFVIVGATTYPLYLIHQKLGQIIYLHLGDYLNKYVLLILSISLMIFLAYLINRYIENKLGLWMRNALQKWVAKWRPEEDSNPRPAP